MLAGLPTNIQNPTSVVVLRLRLRVLNSEVVLHSSEAQTSRGGAGIRQIPFELVVDDAFKRNMPVLHDDMDRRNGLDRVARKSGVAVNGAGDAEPQAVIERRQG